MFEIQIFTYSPNHTNADTSSHFTHFASSLQHSGTCSSKLDSGDILRTVVHSTGVHRYTVQGYTSTQYSGIVYYEYMLQYDTARRWIQTPTMRMAAATPQNVIAIPVLITARHW